MQRLQANTGQAGGLDHSQIPARTLDMQHLLRLTKDIPPGELARGIAAAMQHKVEVRAYQARGIDPERQLAICRVIPCRIYEFFRLGVAPFVPHHAQTLL